MPNAYFLQAEALLQWFPITADSGLETPVVRPFSWDFTMADFPPGSKDLGSPRRVFTLAPTMVGSYASAEGFGDVDVHASIEFGVDDSRRLFVVTLRMAMGKAYKTDHFTIGPSTRTPFMLNIAEKDLRISSHASRRAIGTACSLHGVFVTSQTTALISATEP